MWEQDPGTGRVTTPLEPLVLGAILALIPVLILELDATSDTWRTVGKLIEGAPGIEVQTNALIVVPPSIHGSGAPYVWTKNGMGVVVSNAVVSGGNPTAETRR
jgi:hypothetical protein